MRRLLEGAKQIADYLGLQLHERNERPGADRRRRLASMVVHEDFPAFLIRGRWCAFEHEIDLWVTLQKARTKRQLERGARGRAR